MDAGLVSWARAVKRRRRNPYPVLWLFTDALRLADPLPTIARLPAGLSGVVFRHDGVAGRAALGRAVARCCRIRRIALVVAGDARLAAALGAGVHLREGRWPGARVTLRNGRLRTASAHGLAPLRRVTADLVFLSPAFATASHEEAMPLGPVRWAALARLRPGKVYALGGVSGDNARRLGAGCGGVGGVSAFL